jgi:GrpB-like predicted nucleotidyltransferase (UPF0157 family)
MSDAPIQIVDYNCEWPGQFLAEKRLLERALVRWLVGAPEHIGSTAVPGLSAKPIIDIMAPVQSLVASREAIVAAGRMGYLHYPYKAEVMHWFCKPAPEHRTHHLHLVPAGSPLWRERLSFRDALRSSAQLREQYQALKIRLAQRHSLDREAYTEAKSPFVRAVLALSLQGGSGAV